jgi:hypothetical protein
MGATSTNAKRSYVKPGMIIGCAVLGRKKTRRSTIMIRDMNVLSCKSVSISYSMGEEEEVNGKTDHLDFQGLGSRG